MGRTDDELRQRRDDLEAQGAAQRAQLDAFNVDPAHQRKVDLTFWAPNEATAQTLAEALTKNELPRPLVLGPTGREGGDPRWLVRTSMMASVDFITQRENVVTFLLFADKYECDFGGWGTAVVEAAGRPES